jgi:hypothetical protein
VRVPMRVEVSATIRNSLDHTIYVHGLASRPEASLQPQPPTNPTTTADAAATLEVPPGAVREVRFKSGAAGSYYYWASNDRQSLLMRTGPTSLITVGTLAPNVSCQAFKTSTSGVYFQRSLG